MMRSLILAAPLILAACGEPASEVPDETTTPPATVLPVLAPGSSEEPDPTEGSDSEVSYANCTEVRAVGADPIRRGEPGFGSHLDRDNDGIACE
jgi:hypothetical protein